MAIIEVDEDFKHTVAFAARMANVSESAFIRRSIAAGTLTEDAPTAATDQCVAVYADNEGHRVQALGFSRGERQHRPGLRAGAARLLRDTLITLRCGAWDQQGAQI